MVVQMAVTKSVVPQRKSHPLSLLDNGYLAELNNRYTCPATDEANLYRLVEQHVKLDQVLGEQHLRVVVRDGVRPLEHQHLQIDKRHESLALAGKQVIVKQKRDGPLPVEHAGELLDYRQVISRPEPPRRQKPEIKNNKKRTSRPTHPWKQGLPSLAAIGGGGISAAAKGVTSSLRYNMG
jgi:hypothetical protein